VIGPAHVRLLACPLCGGGLAPAPGGASLRCTEGHAFDLTRRGTLTLLAGDARPGGDTPAMVAAREAFLGAGHLDPLSATLARVAAAAVGPSTPGAVVEVGAGTGHHLARVMTALPGRPGVALDRAEAAVRRAGRLPGVAAVRCDVWKGLPLRDGVAALVLDVFAPRNGPEIARVLHPDGALVVASPAPDHLGELTGPLGLLAVDPGKPGRIAAALGEGLPRTAAEECRFTMRLGHAELALLAGMGPSAHHLDPAEVAGRIARLPDPVAVTAAVVVATHRPAGQAPATATGGK
jgi:23S rRNA (guanine745-N1)-methyltransferase